MCLLFEVFEEVLLFVVVVLVVLFFIFVCVFFWVFELVLVLFGVIENNGVCILVILFIV